MDEFATCTIPVTITVAVFGIVVLVRWFKHREILAMVDKGVVPEQYAQYAATRQDASRYALLGWGVALVMLGLALLAGLWPIGFVAEGSAYPLGITPWLLFGLIPLAIGLALLIIYAVIRKDDKAGEESETRDKMIEPPED